MDSECKDERFYTPRQSARTAGSSSSDGERISPRPTAYGFGSGISESENEFFATPRDARTTPRGEMAPPKDGNAMYDECKQHCWESSYDSYRQHAKEYRSQHTKAYFTDEDGLARPNLGRAESKLDSDWDCSGESDRHDFIESIFSFARHNRVDEVERLMKRGVPPDVRDEVRR